MTVAADTMSQDATEAVAKVVVALRDVPESERADVLATASHLWIHTGGTLDFDRYEKRR